MDDNLFEDQPFDENLFEDTKFEDNLFEDKPLDKEDIEDDSISRAETALMGLGEGATFGLGDIAAGIGAVGMEAVEDLGDILGVTEDAELREKGFKISDDYKGLKGLVDAYYAGREKSRALKEEGAEKYPATYYGSTILGGAATSGAIPKALPALRGLVPSLEGAGKGATIGKKIASSAAEGFKAGALAGFGGGEGKLLEGEIGKTLKETTKGAALGSLIGAGTGSLAEGVKAGARKIGGARIFEPIRTGYRWGKEGKSLDEKIVRQETKELSEKLIEVLDKSKKLVGKSLGEVEDLAQEANVRVSAGEDVREVQLELMNKLAKGLRSVEGDEYPTEKAFGEITEVLDTWAGKTVPKMKQKVAQKLADIRSKQAGLKKQADVKLQKKAAQKMLKTGDQGEIVDEMIESADEALVGGKPEIKSKAMDVKTTKQVPVKNIDTGEVELEDVDVIERFVTDVTPSVPRVDWRRKGQEVIARISDRVSGKELAKIRGVMNEASNLDDLSFSEAQSLLSNINAYTGPNAKIDNNEVKGLMKLLASKVKTKIEKSVEGLKGGESLSRLKGRYKELTAAQKELGIKPGDITQDEKSALKAARIKLSGIGETSQIGKETLFERMKAAGIKPTGKMQERTSFLDDVRRITGDSEGNVKIHRANIVTQGASGGANIVGKGVRAVGKGMEAGKTYIKNNYQSLLDASPEKISNIAEKLVQKGGAAANYASQLMKAATKDDRLRTAVLFGLYQQPGFREIIRQQNLEEE